MIHAFLLVVMIGEVEINRRTPMYFRDINECLYFAKKVSTQYGNLGGYYSTPPAEHKVTSYCKPVFIPEQSPTLY